MTFVHRTWRLGLLATVLLFAAAAISPALGATSGVSIADKHFDPATITVAQGDTVAWTVTRSIGEPHTVKSGKPSDADTGAAFDSQKADPNLTKLKDNGATFSVTFDKPGRFAYFCSVHPADMTGEVVVLAPGQSTPEAHEGVPAQNKLIGAAILVVTLIVLFGAAWLYRRMNPA